MLKDDSASSIKAFLQDFRDWLGELHSNKNTLAVNTIGKNASGAYSFQDDLNNIVNHYAIPKSNWYGHPYMSNNNINTMLNDSCKEYKLAGDTVANPLQFISILAKFRQRETCKIRCYFLLYF